MIKGFREFILRGNVIDLAVAVVIGAAFTMIVNAIVAGLINPLIALFFDAKSLEDVGPHVTGIHGQDVFFPIGTIVGALINFLAVAIIVYFVFVYPMNMARKRAEARAAAGAPAEDVPPTQEELLTDIRDLLAAQSPKA